MGTGNINILILEDEHMIITHLKNILENNGFENIYIARTSAQALTLASAQPFHILLADINIDGELDGIETAGILQKMHELTVVFITAYSDEKTLDRAAKVDFIGYLLKPFREKDLKTLLSLILRKIDSTHSALLKISGKYIFDLQENRLYKDASIIRLSGKEERFFILVFNQLDSVIHYSMLDQAIWNGEYVSDNTRRTFLYRIKQKFPDLPVQTIKDVGIKVSSL